MHLWHHGAQNDTFLFPGSMAAVGRSGHGWTAVLELSSCLLSVRWTLPFPATPTSPTQTLGCPPQPSLLHILISQLDSQSGHIFSGSHSPVIRGPRAQLAVRHRTHTKPIPQACNSSHGHGPPVAIVTGCLSQLYEDAKLGFPWGPSGIFSQRWGLAAGATLCRARRNPRATPDRSVPPQHA